MLRKYSLAGFCSETSILTCCKKDVICQFTAALKLPPMEGDCKSQVYFGEGTFSNMECDIPVYTHFKMSSFPGIKKVVSTWEIHHGGTRIVL